MRCPRTQNSEHRYWPCSSKIKSSNVNTQQLQDINTYLIELLSVFNHCFQCILVKLYAFFRKRCKVEIFGDVLQLWKYN